MLRLEGLGKRFGDVVAVDDLTLHVAAGELLTLLGPSGCGKTTTLRMIAGFEPVGTGRVWLGERDVTDLPPQRRGVGMVFQNYALFPHLDVFENVAFGLRARGTPREELPRRVERALELVDLGGYGPRRVQQLSGGQQQRVALARALAPEPPVLLLDEPLSNLDAGLRERTREELRTVLQRIGITSVFVTHDQEEAFALSDRVALLNAGRLEQVGPPEELYADPATPFAAAFVGRASFLPAFCIPLSGSDIAGEVAPGVRWRARPGRPEWSPGPGETIRLMARPEWLALERASEEVRPGGLAAVGGPVRPAGAGPARERVRRTTATRPPDDALPGEVVDRRFAGAATYYRVNVPGGELLVQGAAQTASRGDRVHVRPTALLRAYPE